MSPATVRKKSRGSTGWVGRARGDEQRRSRSSQPPGSTEVAMDGELGGHVIGVVTNAYEQLKAQADRALAQIDDGAVFARLDEEDNSIAHLVKHLAGNLK